uniref:Uridine nucleosidase 1 n=1 Tax=Lygus hesperus TaxID=30085 RepID=A0A0A9X512_LYGHE
MKKLVIVDNDGGVDDAWAIFLMLNDPEIEVIAFTCVFGNTTLDCVCTNNLRLSALFSDNKIPVYRGADSPLIPRLSGSPLPDDFQFFHGRNGFGDVSLPRLPDSVSVRPEAAFIKLNDLAKEYEGQITLVCLGPLTNVALAMRAFPDFVDNLKEVFIMGGNYTALGNSTKRPEFNIHVDPEAADIVFRGLGDKCTLLPWETCRSTKITLSWKESLEKCSGQAMKFLHAIEAPLTSKKKAMGFDNFVSSDVLLAVVLTSGDAVVRDVRHHLGVELAGTYTRGQLVVLDHVDDRATSKVRIVQEVSAQKYMDAIEALKHL